MNVVSPPFGGERYPSFYMPKIHPPSDVTFSWQSDDMAIGSASPRQREGSSHEHVHHRSCSRVRRADLAWGVDCHQLQSGGREYRLARRAVYPRYLAPHG